MRIRQQQLRKIDKAVAQMNEQEGLPLRELISPDLVHQALRDAGVEFRHRTFDPVTTLAAFVSQGLDDDPSCRKAVNRVNAQRAAEGKSAASTDNTSYCQARMRLPEEMFSDLTRHVAQEAEQQAALAWLWHGRHVKGVDGTTVTMADTEDNRREYPQPSSQEPGLGFPMARLVATFSLATGMVLDMSMGPCEGKQSGENALFRRILDQFEPGDVVLGDRIYDSYRDVAELRRRGVDVVFRMNQSREVDFRRGRRLGDGDHVVTWHRPKFDSARFDRQTYETLPETIEMRELRYEVPQDDFRTETVVVVTTLKDAKRYSKEEIAWLYRERWHCELDLRSLKSVMKMGHLRCRLPAMVRKDIWAHLLAYNLVRAKMAEAAMAHEAQPRRLSFRNAQQAITTYAPKLATANVHQHNHIRAEMLRGIAHERVGDRPDRTEPRKLKKRHNKYSYLTEPRNAA